MCSQDLSSTLSSAFTHRLEIVKLAGNEDAKTLHELLLLWYGARPSGDRSYLLEGDIVRVSEVLNLVTQALSAPSEIRVVPLA